MAGRRPEDASFAAPTIPRKDGTFVIPPTEKDPIWFGADNIRGIVSHVVIDGLEGIFPNNPDEIGRNGLSTPLACLVSLRVQPFNQRGGYTSVEDIIALTQEGTILRGSILRIGDKFEFHDNLMHSFKAATDGDVVTYGPALVNLLIDAVDDGLPGHTDEVSAMKAMHFLKQRQQLREQVAEISGVSLHDAKKDDERRIDTKILRSLDALSIWVNRETLISTAQTHVDRRDVAGLTQGLNQLIDLMATRDNEDVQRYNPIDLMLPKEGDTLEEASSKRRIKLSDNKSWITLLPAQARLVRSTPDDWIEEYQGLRPKDILAHGVDITKALIALVVAQNFPDFIWIERQPTEPLT